MTSGNAISSMKLTRPQALCALCLIVLSLAALSFLHKVREGDPQSFFSKNDRDAFYRDVVIQGADASTFAALTDSVGRPTLFSKDAMHVYVSDPQSGDTSI
jgi:hypothetical protein